MSDFSNPLATVQQLHAKNNQDADVHDSVRYQIARLTEAAGILLRLPHEVAAQAVVLLQRYWLEDDVMSYEFADVSAAAIFLVSKISFTPRTIRSIANVYAYLLSPASALYSSSATLSNPPAEPAVYYLSDSSYHAFRTRILNIEGQILNALGFNTHVALPHPLAITYMQTLDIFTAAYPSGTGTKLAKRVVRHLNSALLSPQLLYLTHQPNALAVASIYLAARETEVKLPEGEWWEVFDVDREELGFLVVGMKSLEGWIRAQGMLVKAEGRCVDRRDVREALSARGGLKSPLRDEEDEMMMLLDEKVGA